VEAASLSAARPGELRWIEPPDLERIRNAAGDPVARAEAFAAACRINVLSMIMEAGSGHIGTSFSCLDMLSWLHLEVLGPDDVSFSSKGHDAPAIYAVLAALGRIEWDLVHRLRRLGGLPGHPDIAAVPQLHTNTGSLGMGVSKAKGFARAARLRGGRRAVYVICGDGELQEGQLWESLGQAANERFGEICVLVDHNKVQSDTWVEHVSDLRDIEGKFTAFGWATGRCDGNDVGAFAAALSELQATEPDRPKVLVADTRKGAGVSHFEPHDLERSGTALYRFHSGAPAPDDYTRALDELEARLADRLAALGEPPATPQTAPIPARSAPARPQRLMAAYGEALAGAAARDERVLALDADLSFDMGLVPFRARFADRFVECGIAEQDMVSQAGTLALEGFIPVCHSFACFLAPRPNEQIYNNATEGTRVIYVGALAGIVPGGPGHSHQSVRDISALGSIPGMALLEPATEHEVRLAVDWAVGEAPGPVYLRLVSVPWELGFEPPRGDALAPGRGTVVREGADATIVTTGPVLLSQAWAASESLAARGVSCAVVSLPWLRDVDGPWLAELTGEAPVVTLDNHYVAGGQGDAVLAALSEAGASVRVHRIGVDRVPVCGANDEVLQAHRLDAASLAERIGEVVAR
jgi:transketolase